MVFLVLDVEDATPESLAGGVQDPKLAAALEAVVRQHFRIPFDLTVAVAPFRNGVVLSPDAAQRVIDTFERFDETCRETVPIESYMPALDDQDEEIVATLKVGLEVIGRGGSEPA